jgi:hypothetical protein
MTQVATMDPDVAITIAFCFEALLVALAVGLFIGHEVCKSRAESAHENRRGYLDRAAMRARPGARGRKENVASSTSDGAV